MMPDNQQYFPANVLWNILTTSTGVLTLIDASTPEALNAFNRIAETSETQQIHWYSAAKQVGETLTAEILASFAEYFIQHWFDGGADHFAALRSAVYLTESEEQRFEVQLLVLLTRGLEAAAELSTTNTTDTHKLVDETWSSFYQLVDLVAAAGHLEHAYHCALVCVNVDPRPSEQRFLFSVERAALLARQLDNQDVVGESEAMLAVATVAAAQRGERTKLAAFDAIVRAVYNLPVGSNYYQQAREWLEPLVTTDDFACLRPLMLLSRPTEQRPVLPDELGNMSLVLSTVTDGTTSDDFEAWLQSLRGSKQFLMFIENQRLAIESALTKPGGTSTASWESWAFHYDPYTRSIPDGSSFLRERDLDQGLLVLSHETNHILSMVSHIGIAIIGLRIAALMVELDLWKHMPEYASLDDAAFFNGGVASLAGVDAAALPQAEQVLEISRKRMILQDVWSPWFEGVAILAELGADPTQDPTSFSPAMEVLNHLVDRSPFLDGEPEGLAEWISKQYGKMERLYADAISNQAYFRLRTYLDKHHQHYLAGYLAVRSMIAAWRRTIARPLSGAEAARILLHITRFGTQETVPDLGLPLDSFRKSVHDLFFEWLSDCVKVTREDLENILLPVDQWQTEEKPFRWRKGRLLFETYDQFKIAAAQDDTIAAFVSQALSSLSVEQADINRVCGTESDVPLREAAELLSKIVHDREFADLVAPLYVQRLNILLIGQVEAPFWLHRYAKAIFCMVRTTEADREDGSPTYNSWSFRLPDEQFAALEREILNHREPRITLRRVADLSSASVARDGRGLGRHYLVLQYGSWLYVQPKGLLFGTSEVDPGLYDEIRARCFPNPMLRFDDEKIADGAAGALRTKQWLAEIDSLEWETAQGMIAWAEYVYDLTDQVLDHTRRTESTEISLALFRFVLGDEVLADAMNRTGLAALKGDDVKRVRSLLRVLDESARMPISDQSGFSGSDWFPLLLEGQAGWDVTTPRGVDQQKGST